MVYLAVVLAVGFFLMGGDQPLLACREIQGPVPCTGKELSAKVLREGIFRNVAILMLPFLWLMAGRLWYGIGFRRNSVIVGRRKIPVLPPLNDDFLVLAFIFSMALSFFAGMVPFLLFNFLPQRSLFILAVWLHQNLLALMLIVYASSLAVLIIRSDRWRWLGMASLLLVVMTCIFGLEFGSAKAP
ncbi:MAG: hypothetical protein Q4G36_10255 [Paracoccus sp. (in: a-proteobacteria)]|nr:hypothetical protein [Paracoccus sp. (in: a-proteobacteria)]